MMNNTEEKIKKAGQWYKKRLISHNCCAQEISKLIEKLIKHEKISYNSITYRVKTEESFKKKCEKEKYINPKEEIKDIVGIRIITYTNREVRQICELIKKEFTIDNENSVNKADILEADKVGYLSVHYIAKINNDRESLPEYSELKDIWFEIQIRTLLQHTWAEIEHDKSYKFSGELPKDLKRRFYLIAGTLEQMDIEFEKLSDDIDLYAVQVQEKTKEGNYNIAIDSTSLFEYMKNKYGENDNIIETIIDNKIIEELRNFDCNTLKDIEDITQSDFEILEPNTYTGILRYIMIMNNPNKYFTKAYKKWAIDKESINYFNAKGIDINKYIQEYNIEIRRSLRL